MSNSEQKTSNIEGCKGSSLTLSAVFSNERSEWVVEMRGIGMRIVLK